MLVLGLIRQLLLKLLYIIQLLLPVHLIILSRSFHMLLQFKVVFASHFLKMAYLLPIFDRLNLFDIHGEIETFDVEV